MTKMTNILQNLKKLGICIEQARIRALHAGTYLAVEGKDIFVEVNNLTTQRDASVLARGDMVFDQDGDIVRLIRLTNAEATRIFETA